MYKQIYRKTDGMPELIQDRYDEESEVSIFDYDKDLYTDSMPASYLYQPIQFNEETNEWIGVTKEEWESNQSKPPIEPDGTDFLNAQLISNDIEHNAKINGLEQDVANLTSELLEMKGGVSDVSNT
ncbi:hypothetical protein [Mammaliicoccus sciuri]|uniref:hypothetical protein n=1 Tax=Mammaliicoccus sciuri TaxID=1296 RepID=UPI002DBBFC78|nr:hypothetical protein [Mammaliicoccus sciuri]MEB6292196.1 hypothetical protein [Mammaliicoccus sciuri]